MSEDELEAPRRQPPARVEVGLVAIHAPFDAPDSGGADPGRKQGEVASLEGRVSEPLQEEIAVETAIAVERRIAAHDRLQVVRIPESLERGRRGEELLN